jgi:hypothetical protein
VPDNSKPAFPMIEFFDGSPTGSVGGMTLREYYVGQAMKEFLNLYGGSWSGTKMSMQDADRIAGNCVVMADAMVRAVNK